MAKKAESDHMNKVVSLGCIVCLNNGYYDTPAEVHHIGNQAMGKRASNYETIPLCPFIIGLEGTVSQSIQAVKHGLENSEQKKSCLNKFCLWCYNTIGLIIYRVCHGVMERCLWVR
jgi:hypothetical protein